MLALDTTQRVVHSHHLGGGAPTACRSRKLDGSVPTLLLRFSLLFLCYDPLEEIGAVFGDEATFNLHEAGKKGVDEELEEKSGVGEVIEHAKDVCAGQ
ncbi:hypothetical protein LTR37_006674 [Vermiconidia calcicola]|uniref:Uncharacterized protein n=1 Tax=Vermiconidia calcicola TaxID=1690605 RepID=A0ACC3NH96_9PEZI|nr:hypothetical protein LTR37_006674 [Vermiconidia calcicola]